jgi:hypothetical protein
MFEPKPMKGNNGEVIMHLLNNKGFVHAIELFDIFQPV